MVGQMKNEVQDGDVNNVQAAIDATTTSLHGIVSRTAAAEVAREVVRLNAGVRVASAGRVGPFDQPSDFARVLLSGADSTNQAENRP